MPATWMRGAGKRLSLLIPGAVTVVVLGCTVWLARRGLDLTDEAFYLHWMADPDRFDASTTLFGFVYHPWYLLVGGDLVGLRWLNILVTSLLVGAFACALLATTIVARGGLRVALAVGVTALAPLGFRHGLVTPNYNTLVVQGALVVLIGLVIAERSSRRAAVVAGLMVGAGGTLLFLAKPTAAVTMALVGLVHLAARRRGWCPLLMAGCTSTVSLAAVAVWIDGSFGSFIRRLHLGAAEAQVLDASHDIASMLRYDPLNPGGVTGLTLFSLWTGAVLLAMWAAQARGRQLVLGWAGALVAVSPVVLILVRHPELVTPLRTGRWVLVLAIPLACLALWLVKRPAVDRRSLVWIITLLLVPHATALGTNVSTWHMAGSMAYCWVLAGVILVARPSPAGRPAANVQRSLVVLILAAQAAAITLLAATAHAPYRQPGPLWSGAFASAGTDVLLAPTQRAFVLSVRKLAEKADIPEQASIIDLSGMSPGVVWLLAREPAERPWVIGGYPGSERLERRILARTSCDRLSRAWLLVEPGGPRALSPEVLTAFSADLANFEEVASTRGFRTVEYPDRGRLTLMRPLRSEDAAASACEERRADISARPRGRGEH